MCTDTNKLPADNRYEAGDTAGYFVRLRETSVVCMRLEEAEEEEDGTLLMLMRERSVSVINIGGLTVKRWIFSALFLARFVSLWPPARDAVTAVRSETRIIEKSEGEKNGFVSAAVWPVFLLTQVDHRWKTASK